MRDPYDVLGISPGASRDDVARAYRRAVMRAHPDHGGTRAEFDLVQGAYAWLVASVDAQATDHPVTGNPSAGGMPNPVREHTPEPHPSDQDAAGEQGASSNGDVGGLRRAAGPPRRGMPVQKRRRWWQS